MKPIWFLLALTFGAVGCANTRIPKNRNDGYAPATVVCVDSTDPNCVGQATIGIATPIDKSKGAIFGRCEVWMEGEKAPRSCSQLQLVLKSSRDNEQKMAVVEGFNFQFVDLKQDSYKLGVSSENYDVQTDNDNLDALSPGQTVKIRVRAKPRP